MAAGLSKTKWNANGSYHSSSVSNTSLDVTLSYEGKKDEKDVLAIKSAKVQVLWQNKGECSNRLYYGDNLPLLASLLHDYRGKVRLIYIDPPYATKSVFQSRSQNDAYTDLLTGAHYIEFIRERIILLRELLADDGSIYVHLDENMAFHIKMIMDEVFGAKNFRNWITRKKCNPKNYTRKTYGDVSDYILFYTKSDDYVWNRAIEQWTDERAKKEYTYVEEETGRRYKKVPVHAPGIRNGETGKSWKGMMPPPGKHWQYTPKTLDEMDARGDIYWSPNGNPRRKIYLDNTEGVPVQDIWLDFKDAHNQNIKITGYPTEKNPDLIKRIIEASSNPNDIVLDCFAGSGTTLDMASKLNRNWIGIDNSPEAIATTLERFHKGTKAMGDFVTKRSGTKKPARLFNDKVSIADFILYTTDSNSKDLKDILKEWESWQYLPEDA
jgi:adenine-specific DNA-methyltransferase